MDMVVNYYGQKYAERSYGYKYLLHKRVPNPLKFRRIMSDLEHRALMPRVFVGLYDFDLFTINVPNPHTLYFLNCMHIVHFLW